MNAEHQLEIVTITNKTGDKFLTLAGYDGIMGIKDTNVEYTDYEVFQEILEHNSVGFYASPAESFDISKAKALLSTFNLVIVENLS